MNISLKSSANRKRYVYSIFGLFLDIFGAGSELLGCDWRRNFFKNGDGLS